ncbi:MAG: DUF4215 domain-containing protein [Deltaproteobacteria bacterium]|nr:DUF4215 domain-containing protein [Deltaproteobacteria bacterium]
MRRVDLIAAGAALLTAACLADPTLPEDVGGRTPCSDTSDCPEGHTCPTTEGTQLARCVPTARAACGNDVLDELEQCDDGNWIDGDGCRADCSAERCGDGRVDAGEDCDEGGASPTCSALCTSVVCGDLIIEAPEICDDGNTVGGDGCSIDCLHLEYCGNDLLDPGEACDDANHVSGDGCRADCAKVEVCGDRIVDEGEECDDGNANPSDGCHQCAQPVWTARVLTGLGESGGDPLALHLSNVPSGAYDRSGRVLFADGIARLWRIEAQAPAGPAGDRLLSVVGTGSYGFSGDGGPATGATIDAPFGFDLDDAGRIFLADTLNARVRLIDTDGVISTIAGTGTHASSGDGGLAVLAEVHGPVDVALDRFGDLFVAERDNCRVRKIAGVVHPSTATISTVAGGDCGDADYISPSGLAVDEDGSLYIADRDRAVVWRLTHGASGPGSSALTRVAGVLDVVGQPIAGVATAVTLGAPNDVAVEGDNLYIADRMNHQILLVVDGALTVYAGSSEEGFAGDGGPAASARLSRPMRVAARGGRLLVSDTNNRRLREIDADGVIRTLAGRGPSPRPQHAVATSLAVDGAGDAYLGDLYQAVLWKVARDGTTSVVAGIGSAGYDGEGLPAVTSSISNVTSIAFDASGALVLAEPALARLRRIAADGSISTLAGNGAHEPLALDGELATGPLGEVDTVALDPTTGLLWFSARGQFTIRRINADSTLSTMVGTGVEGFAGDGGSGALAELGLPADLAFTDEGILLFADPRNQRVRSYDPVLDLVDTVAGTGDWAFNGDGINARTANLDGPERITVAADGAILIAAWGQRRVRRVDSDGLISTVAGDGSDDLIGDGGPSAAAHVIAPRGLRADRSSGAAVGDLVLADFDDDRGVLRRVRSDIIDSVNALFAEGLGPLDRGALATPPAFVSLAPVASDVVLVAGGESGLLERVTVDAALLGGGAIDIAAARPDGFVLGADAAAGGDPFPVGGEARARYLDRFGDACGIAFDGVDAVYVADRARAVIARVRLVDVDDPSSWTVALVAGALDDRRHVDSADGPARFVGPCGLALDATAHALFVADADDATVRRVDLDDGNVVTLFGVAGLVGSDEDLLDEPSALVVDAQGALFVADTGNHRVRRMSVAGDTVVEVVDVLGTGEAASAGDGAPARTFPVEAPRGLAIDAHGNLLVSSTRTVRLVTADAEDVVDGSGAVLTLFGQAPRDTFPANSTFCLAGVGAPSDGVVRVVDACQGSLVELTRAP